MTQPSADSIAAAKLAMAKWKIPASIQLAQWADESGWGIHDLGCFNFFGQKDPCDEHGKPIYPFVMRLTHEEDKYGRVITISAPFRKFDSAAQGFDAHAALLAKAPVYASAMRALPSVTAFVAAMAPHYATDHQYAAKLMAIINGSNLTQYDKGVV